MQVETAQKIKMYNQDTNAIKCTQFPFTRQDKELSQAFPFFLLPLSSWPWHQPCCFRLLFMKLVS